MISCLIVAFIPQVFQIQNFGFDIGYPDLALNLNFFIAVFVFPEGFRQRC
jgi:hypothetical protein